RRPDPEAAPPRARGRPAACPSVPGCAGARSTSESCDGRWLGSRSGGRNAFPGPPAPPAGGPPEAGQYPREGGGPPPERTLRGGRSLRRRRRNSPPVSTTSLRRLLLDEEVSPTVLRPASLALVGANGPLLAVADHRDPARVDPHGHQVVAGRLR